MLRVGDGGQREFREGLISFEQLKRGPWLFDVLADPEEREDLAESMPEKVAFMRAKLARYMEQSAPPHTVPKREQVLLSRSRFLPSGQPIIDVWPPTPTAGWLD